MRVQHYFWPSLFVYRIIISGHGEAVGTVGIVSFEGFINTVGKGVLITTWRRVFSDIAF